MKTEGRNWLRNGKLFVNEMLVNEQDSMLVHHDMAMKSDIQWIIVNENDELTC